jgi:DNA-binding NarL/FixJ family response regulator
VFIVDDHPITRYGLLQLIDREPDLTVCGEADNAVQALEVLRSTQPDIVLADLTMPGRSGLDFIKDLHALQPQLPILVMSMHDESIYAERVLRAGARGYIMKSQGGERLLEALRHVLNGEVWVSAQVSSFILDCYARGRSVADGARPGSLTDREFEIFELLGQGLTTREIGRRLSLSTKTVSTHRSHIMQKLKVDSGPELIRQAVRWAAAQQLV